jgi:cellulose synthase/poly-beta-1,6-N-acetylglucosamine synthase-like glycosyltransferase
MVNVHFHAVFKNADSSSRGIARVPDVRREEFEDATGCRGEQHVREDLGFIPSFAGWVKAIRPEPWTSRSETGERTADNCGGIMGWERALTEASDPPSREPDIETHETPSDTGFC